jgi:phage-related protein (TIGR01555 family)
MFGKKASAAVAAVVQRAKGWFGADGSGRRERTPAGERFATMIDRARAASPIVRAGAMDDSTGANTIKAAYNAGLAELPEALIGWFLSQSFIGHQLAAYLAQHWLIAKACAMPARDAIRQGYTVVSDDGKDLDPKVTHAIKKADERFRINAHMRDFITKGRTFGIRIALFKVESTDAEYYTKPFNPDGVTPGSYKGIVQVDPYWCAPEFDQASAIDPASIHFYEPTWWIINGKKYHRSHLVVFRNGDVADLLKPSYGYGGVPVPQLIMERVYASERTANEAPQLAMTKRTTTFATNVAEALANEELFNERMADWARYRDNYAVKLLDKEADEMQQFDTSLADLDAVIMSQYQLVAAAANVPATKLLGTTPKGFNATGEYEESSYHEELESIQANDLAPLIERHHLLVMRSHIAPKVINGAPISTSVVWAPLDSPTAKELAETNNSKANADKALVESGAIDAFDVRKRLREDKDSGYYGIAESVPEEPIEAEPAITLAEPGAVVAADAMDGVRLMTNQSFIDEAIVAQKIIEKDFTVQVSPVFRDETGALYRIVIDGHHSLEAAKRCRMAPTLVEGDYAASDYVAVAEIG